MSEIEINQLDIKSGVIFNPLNTVPEDMKSFIGDLITMQKAVKNALKDASNPYFKSKYSSLGSIFDACKEACNNSNFFISHDNGRISGEWIATTSLLHTTGHKIVSSYVIPNGLNVQDFGKTTLYYRRYLLAPLVGVVTTDDMEDDGNSLVFIDKDETQKIESSLLKLSVKDNEEFFRLMKVKELKLIKKADLGKARNWMIAKLRLTKTEVINEAI